MSNLLVKHGRTFSPAKLRNQSKIERLPPWNSVRVKNNGLNRHPVSLRKEHDRKRFVFSTFLDRLRRKARTQLATAARGLGRYAQREAFSSGKGLPGAELQNHRFRRKIFGHNPRIAINLRQSRSFVLHLFLGHEQRINRTGFI